MELWIVSIVVVAVIAVFIFVTLRQAQSVDAREQGGGVADDEATRDA